MEKMSRLIVSYYKFSSIIFCEKISLNKLTHPSTGSMHSYHFDNHLSNSTSQQHSFVRKQHRSNSKVIHKSLENEKMHWDVHNEIILSAIVPTLHWNRNSLFANSLQIGNKLLKSLQFVYRIQFVICAHIECLRCYYW